MTMCPDSSSVHFHFFFIVINSFALIFHVLSLLPAEHFYKTLNELLIIICYNSMSKVEWEQSTDALVTFANI